MTGGRFVARSLVYHWRIHLGVALGVAAATAVLTGALLVGDSVRGSLRRLTLDRLGRVDEVLASDRFFRRSLAVELAGDRRFAAHFEGAEPAILFTSATVERQGAGRAARASRVLVLGIEPTFWQLGNDGVAPGRMPGRRELVLNQPLAEDLGVAAGDEIMLRLPDTNQVPTDSALARKSSRVRSLGGWRVVEVIPSEGLGRFNLRASQTLPRNAYASLEALQEALGEPGRINAILVSGRSPEQPPGESASRALARSLRPALDDFGLAIKHVRRTHPAEGTASPHVIYDYFSVTTDRLIFAPEAGRALERAVSPYGGQAVLTYLATAIETISAGKETPPESIAYSMVTAVDITPAFPLRNLDGDPIEPLGEGEMVLTQWSAAALDARPGDAVRIRYFEPETAHGKAIERGASFRVKAVTPLVEPAEPYRRNRPAVYRSPPALANDPDLTPEVKGVTDQETIDDWDPPFPFDYRRIRPRDEDYWARHRTTPKAFISLATGQKLWGSRFGEVTSLRVPAAPGLPEHMLRQSLVDALLQAGAPGFEFLPVKRQQLAASQGTTPFDGLFLALSFFIIAAALLLVALLFGLGMERRSAELGTLLALGLRRRYVSRLFVLEGAAVSAIGGLLGLAVGIGYSRLMLSGLSTWWVGAITTPFLRFGWTWRSLAIGYTLGVLVSLGAIAGSVRRVRHVPLTRLLAGQTAETSLLVYRPPRFARAAVASLLALAAGLLVAAVSLSGMEQAGAFVGGGASLLGGSLLFLWGQLRRGGGVPIGRRLSLAALAVRNAARNPGRSALTVGLMATASFLIVAMSSFRLAPTEQGTGGFDLVAESSEPVFEDLNQQGVRRDLLGDGAKVLSGAAVFGLRLRPGDDASCNNLYQPSQPRVLGATAAFLRHFDDPQAPSFAWASTLASSGAERANPWRLLENAPVASEGAIPAVVDMNTALYSLKPAARVGGIYEARYGGGRNLRFRVVGHLENSILQGALIISERDFTRAFPDISGYRYFLIRSRPGASERVAAVLEDRLGDQGLDAISARRLLEQLQAVQNTYLNTFQSLGGIGLLLGTFGLAAVQMRNVLERRKELALLRAAGFASRRLARLVLWENILLLVAGLATGAVAALCAVLPHKLLGTAAVPLAVFRDLGAMLAAVLLVGLLAGWASTRASLRAPILQALRGE